MKRILFLAAIIALTLPVLAGSVDTVDIFSNAMNRIHRCVVIKPAAYKKKKRSFPVVYLLHGYSGNYGDWIRKVPQLMAFADVNNLIIVCPDGNYSSWYYDSPVDSAWKYETYITAEVIPFIDSRYRTVPDAAHRAITGLSMGGHGGLFLGLRHNDLFGACGSMSGGVDINASRLKYDISKRIGDTVTYAPNWQQYSVYYLIDRYAATQQHIIFDCGTEDFYYPPNHSLHEKMLRLKIPHDYIERPGRHDWAYWQNAVAYQLLFFSNCFVKVNRKE